MKNTIFESSKMIMKKILALLAASLAFTTMSMASNPKSDFTQERSSKGGPQIRTEWGVTGAIYYNTMQLVDKPHDTAVATLSTRPRLGYGVGLHMALRIGRFFAIQPEVNYHYSSIKSGDSSVKRNANVKINTVDIPVLLSFRLGNIFRLNAGPLFTVMNNCFYTDAKDEKQMFGNTRPTFGYSAGAAFVLLRKLMLDVRYIGYFKPTLQNYEGTEFNSRNSSIALKIGFLF